MNTLSDISGLYKLNMKDRLRLIKELRGLTDDETRLISTGGMNLQQADRMIENVIGVFSLPLGIATNFLVNRKNYLIPMAIEEPSVVAAASNAAKMARERGGFTALTTPSVMIGQIQLVDIKDLPSATATISDHKAKILKVANAQDPMLISLGGGARDLRVKSIDTRLGCMLIAELLIDCRDAAGMNAVDSMTEAITPMIEKLSGGKAVLRIISNLATERLARSSCTIPKEAVGGPSIVDNILKAQAFAEADPYRCTTHNKGIMNGVIAVVLATGNDHRAIEAGAHAYACKSGRYQPLTSWEKNEQGDLVGSIELPMAVGTVGGATKSHPLVAVVLKILGVESSRELAEVIASVGLAQNFAALRALSDEGIQRGHMRLHARNLAASAGAVGEEIDVVASTMVKEGKIRADRARAILDDIRGR